MKNSLDSVAGGDRGAGGSEETTSRNSFTYVVRIEVEKNGIRERAASTSPSWRAEKWRG